MNKNKINDVIQNRFLQKQHDLNIASNQSKDSTEVLAEAIMDNIHNTPLGKLLGIIAALPEIRTEKVERGKNLVKRHDSDLDEQLDVALDRVLEELLSES